MPSARPPLSRDRVVAEAMALADERGLAALSMRALAGRLGVEAMSLYHHVPGKESLLDAMVDAVFSELHLPVVGGEWRTELRARSVSGRTALLRHPWAVGLMDSRRTPGPHNLSHHDAVLGCLAAQGFSLVDAGTAFALLDAHLYGFMQQEVSLPFDGEADLAALGAELLGPEVRAAYPHLTAFAEGRAMKPGYSFGDEFGVSLDLVLGALATLLGPGPVAPGALGAPDAASPLPAAASAPAVLEVTVPVLGVDGCPGGWVGAVLVPGAPRPRVVVAPTIELLVETVRADVDIQVVGIDIPIGLPDSTVRQADVLARRSLPGRASSVFTTLTRSAYLAPDRASADAVNRGLSGQGVGAQAFALRATILEVDAWLGTRPTVDVGEVHPEVSFRAMTGASLPGKRSAEGRQGRLDALAAVGINRPSVLTGSGYAADDVLDACAVAWSAHRRASGDARWLPDPPEVFSDGIRAAIVV
jgi:predicted RNase H-like nuclease/AcrR family transcriptional regulator